MPHNQDVADDPSTPSKYECLQCGRIVESDHNPGLCSECGGDFQNRANSLE